MYQKRLKKVNQNMIMMKMMMIVVICGVEESLKNYQNKKLQLLCLFKWQKNKFPTIINNLQV
jgi:hypothetical protein